MLSTNSTKLSTFNHTDSLPYIYPVSSILNLEHIAYGRIIVNAFNRKGINVWMIASLLSAVCALYIWQSEEADGTILNSIEIMAGIKMLLQYIVLLCIKLTVSIAVTLKATRKLLIVLTLSDRHCSVTRWHCIL